MTIVQNIEHSYATPEEPAAVLPNGILPVRIKTAAPGYLNTRGRQTSYLLQRCTYRIATVAQILVLHVRIHESSYTIWVRKCPVSCARSAQNISRNENMKTKWGRSSRCRFSLTCTPGFLWVHCNLQYI